jgi:predicted NUDIX family NTP pyrophosphohydrolase
MGKKSAGLLLYREVAGEVQVFLVHPGGPLWVTKDDGAWSMPKGEFEETEDAFAAALREFEEETGIRADGAMVPDAEGRCVAALDPVRQPSGKTVYAWAARGDLDATAVRSNEFTMEWPPRSGRKGVFPEVDRGGWFPLEEAAVKIVKGQLPLLEQLREVLGAS